MIVAGVGVEPGTPPAVLRAALDRALSEAGVEVTVVATIDTRAGEPAVVALAAGRALVTYPAAALDVVDVPHPSAVVRRLTGTGSVAEAAALLAAGPGAVLVVGKRTGPGVTVAVARHDAGASAGTG